MARIYLGQLSSNGDCLYATTVARQIKSDFPGCHLTWGISSLCRRVIENNPYVDEVHEVPVASWADVNRIWYEFEAAGRREVERGTYDHAFFTQICPNYFCSFDGTVRPPIFRNYPHPITVPVTPVIRLTEEEIARVDEWVEKKDLRSFRKVVLCECASKSGQSFMTPEMMVRVAGEVIRRDPSIAFVLSTHLPIEAGLPQIIHGGELSMRETARLTHFSDLFVGCGSGLTVVATSEAAKPNIPNIQVLSRETSVFASFKHDFEYFGLESDHFLEITRQNPKRLAAAIHTALKEGFETAIARYAETLPLDFAHYFQLIDLMLLQEHRFLDAARSVQLTIERYGPRKDLVAFAQSVVLPFLKYDVAGMPPDLEEAAEALNRKIAAA